MATLKTEHDFDLTRNWYRKSVFLDELWHGMTVATLNSYIRQMKDSPYSFGIKGTHGNVFIHSVVFVAWFDYKIANQYVAKMA